MRWLGVRFGPTSFGIFDVFPDAAGRQAHLDGDVATALQSTVGSMIQQPTFEQVEVVVKRPPV